MTLFIASVPPLCVIAMLANTYSPQQPNEPARSGVGICQREGKRLVGVQPIAARGKIGLPKKTKNVRPRYPALPPGTRQRGLGVWIGEVLVDSEGKVAKVWTVREPELTPPFPAFTDAIIAAIRQWEYERLILPKGGPTPFCLTVTVTTHVKLDRMDGRPRPGAGRAQAALVSGPPIRAGASSFDNPFGDATPKAAILSTLRGFAGGVLSAVGILRARVCARGVFAGEAHGLVELVVRDVAVAFHHSQGGPAADQLDGPRRRTIAEHVRAGVPADVVRGHLRSPSHGARRPSASTRLPA